MPAHAGHGVEEHREERAERDCRRAWSSRRRRARRSAAGKNARRGIGWIAGNDRIDDPSQSASTCPSRGRATRRGRRRRGRPRTIRLIVAERFVASEPSAIIFQSECATAEGAGRKRLVRAPDLHEQLEREEDDEPHAEEASRPTYRHGGRRGRLSGPRGPLAHSAIALDGSSSRHTSSMMPRASVPSRRRSRGRAKGTAMSARMRPGRPDMTMTRSPSSTASVDVVRHEHHGARGRPAQIPSSSLLHVAARLCVERAEGFIH